MKYTLHLINIIQLALHPSNGLPKKYGKSDSHHWGQGWYIQFVLHIILDEVAVQPRASCLYLDCITLLVGMLLQYIHHQLYFSYVNDIYRI